MSAIDDGYIKDLLERLLKTPSPTGYTDEVTRLCCEELQKLGVRRPYRYARRAGETSEGERPARGRAHRLLVLALR